MTFTSAVTLAMAIPNLERHIKITAREQSINTFLDNVFGQLDLPVSVDVNVKGVVNASFNSNAKKLIQDIKRGFGLVTYYDGAVVYVNVASDVNRKILSVTPSIAKRVVRSANEMRLTDKYNILHTTIDGSLVVTGVSRFIELIEQLVASATKAQSARPPLGYKVFYLRYAWAEDVTINAAGRKTFIPGVASILRSLFSPIAQRNTQSSSSSQRLEKTVPKLRGKGLASIGTQKKNKKVNDEIASTVSLGSNLLETKFSSVPTGYPNEARIEADSRLNAVIVRDTLERMPHYERLIASLDAEPQSLEIEATIIDVDTDKMRELGINWRGNDGNKEILFGSGTDSDLGLNASSAAKTAIGQGSFISLVLGGGENFIARINALETEGAASIVSRPQVLTLSNVEATFNVNSTVYVRVAGIRDVDLFNISVGTLLRVKPHVFKKNNNVWIKLMVSIEDGSITTDSVDGIPIVENSSINTQALIQSGESLLIGGMVREISQETVYKVPLLGSIPLIGALFRSKQTREAHIERLFLISPRLTSSREVLSKLSDNFSTGLGIRKNKIKEPTVDEEIIFDFEE